MAQSTRRKMKLVFVSENEHPTNFEEIIGKGCKTLTSTLRNRFSSFSYLGITPLIQIGSTETLRVECSLEFQCDELWSQMPKFSQLIVDHWYSASNNQTGFRVSIFLQDRTLFNVKDFKGADLRIKSTDVYFGNLIRYNEFLCHYKIDQNPEGKWYGNSKIMQKMFSDNPLSTDSLHTIYLDFEHDLHRLLIYFPVLWPDPHSNIKERIEAVTKLQMPYATIRRILINYANDGALNLYLHVRSVPLISVVKYTRRNIDGSKTEVTPADLRTTPGDRHVHWIPFTNGRAYYKEDVRAIAEAPYLKISLSTASNEDYAHILGRLQTATRKTIEIRGIDDMVVPETGAKNSRVQNSYSNVKRYAGARPLVKLRPEDTDIRFKYAFNPMCDPEWNRVFQHNNKSDFAIRYLFDALMSQGAHMTDQFLVLPTHRDTFMKKIRDLYGKNRRLALETLERMLNSAVEFEEMVPLYSLFDIALAKARTALEAELEDEEENVKKGYVRLRKVTITPSRCIYDPPEMIMGNRVLRADEVNFPTDRFIRVSFRDDDFSRIRPNIGAKFIQVFVMNALKEGINIASRRFNYLGSSNSQMREQGCYFIEANDKEISEFRQKLGAFSVDSVPKLMARFGQCFTQSYALGEDMPREKYANMPDFVGGRDSNNEPYTFSDGVGCMSYEFARAIAKSMNMGDCVPSCLQSRFRGFKGVHAINPVLDSIKAYAQEHGLDESGLKSNERFLNVDLWFRESQEKFITPQGGHKYEVVKVSAPSAVCLNRPLINILDQISMKQGKVCHDGMVARIHQLLDDQLQAVAESLTDETAARTRLGEFPRTVMYDVLPTINLTKEPFFRSLLRIAARTTLKKLRSKLQIAIPPHLGRSMLGVVDETGLLGYGEVFIRYTSNVNDKRPGPASPRVTVTGDVLVTKNPMIVGGDVRMFTAVDLSILNHLCDVIVFPRFGPRPHPDEMAGSDLDGDEYCVIWDRGLFLVENEEAFDYTSQKGKIPEPVNEDQLRTQMSRFFVDYISHDSIGKLATAFLVNADIYGLGHEVCHKVAVKHMSAVDFPKTGIPSEKLTKGKPNQMNEDPSRKPDFMEQLFKPTYISTRLNGQLFRRVKEIDDILEISVEEDLNIAPKIDPTYARGEIGEQYMEIARTNFSRYKVAMENLLQRFGISTEAEVFTQCYSAIRRRIGEKEEDDMSFFNTLRLIEDEMEHIYSFYRKEFIESFGGNFEDIVDSSNRKVHYDKESRRILRYPVRNSTDELEKLAVAYYRVAYSQGNQKLLSFAWLCADVLFRVRQKVLSALTKKELVEQRPYSFNPIGDYISDHMKNYFKTSKINWKMIVNFITSDKTILSMISKEGHRMVRRLCRRHCGLPELLYYCVTWMNMQPFFSSKPSSGWKLALLFILFGAQEVPNADRFTMFLEIENWQNSGKNEVDLNQQNGGIGAKLLSFFEYMAARRFSQLTKISFERFKCSEMFYENEIQELHKAALATYYQLCLVGNLAVLPGELPDPSNSLISRRELPTVDGDSFICEIPAREKNFVVSAEVRDALIKKTGCRALFMRILPFRVRDSTVQIVVTLSGSIQATNALRDILTPVLNYSELAQVFTESDVAGYLSRQVLDNIREAMGKKKSVVARTFDEDILID
ncbi:RNA-directed RNA polymerase [Aphelenchoides besseyi]|nr:RNA-directed RNA polymerase [Aphelenchoides besseyi]